MGGGKKRLIVLAAARRVGKGHNAASSLVKNPWQEEEPSPAPQPRHEPDASPKLQQRVDVFFTTPQRGGPWAGPRAGQRFQQKKATEPPRACQLTDRQLTFETIRPSALLLLSCLLSCTFSSLHLFLVLFFFFASSELLRVRFASLFMLSFWVL